jgi:hypothetical protein
MIIMGYKTHLNSELLKNPTKEFVYILGYLWSDGSLDDNSVSLEILESDAKVIANIFPPTGCWIVRQRHRQNRKPTITFYITDSKFTNFLVQHDFKSKSSVSPDKLISWMGEDLFLYFLRGFLDGDGHVKTSRQSLAKKKNKNWMTFLVAFYGSLDQDWSWLSNFCKKLEINNFKTYKRIRDTGKGSEFYLNGRYAHRFCKEIFTTTHFGLQRKYDQFISYQAYLDSSQDRTLRTLCKYEPEYHI